MVEQRKRRKRRKKKRRAVRKRNRMLPMIITILAVLVVVGIAVGSEFVRRYSYSHEMADLNEYYELTGPDEVAIVLQDEILEQKGKILDGEVYLDYDTVDNYFVDNFYVNAGEGILLFTTPTDIISVTIGENSKVYYTGETPTEVAYNIAFYEGETLYIAIDYVKLYQNLSYEVFDSPYRMQVYTEWGSQNIADTTKDTAIRYQGGVKSDILKEVGKGESVIVLETLENWSKVKSNDGFIGYVQNKHLTDTREEAQTPVTEVEEMVYNNISRDHKISLGWHQLTNMDANSSLDTILANVTGLNVISPTWFYVKDSEGNIDSLASQEYVDNAHSRGLEVWALAEDITNEIDINGVLSSTASRRNLIQNLVNTALTYGIDGLNIDFENIDRTSGEHFIQFLRELSIQTRNNNLVLSVDNYVPTEYTAQYDRAAQGEIVDYLIIMGYDEHWSGSSEAGSVASIDYVEGGIERTVALVDPKKVINAVPFYTRIWATGAEVTSSAVGMDRAVSWMEEKGITAVWDEATCQNYAEYQDVDGTLYQVWLEDAESIQTKLNIMEKYDIAGVAAWKLGYENAAIWNVISGYVNS